MSDTSIDRFDDLLKDEGPAAIVLKRKLKPVEGDDSWIFPPTFAQSESAEEDDEGRGGNYQIDLLPDDPRRNVCLIDSVGSQANRIEPIFKQKPYSDLVPQVLIKLKDGDEVNMLDAGHRAADAVLRFSKTYGPKISEAFKLYQAKRDCRGLLQIAPTSLVFGVWDSRATGVKIQRVLRSVIRAYNVTEAKRSATYQAAYDYIGNQVIDPALNKGVGKNNPLSQEGFKYSPATKTHGGVMVKGGIQQEAVINLVALRVLSSDLAIKRYLLGLALVALSYRDQKGFNLREGCLLCAATEEDLHGDWRIVYFNPAQKNELIFQGFTHEQAILFAKKTIEPGNEGVSISHPDSDAFDKETAEKWLALEQKKRKTLAKTKHPAKAIADELVAGSKRGKKQVGADTVGPGESKEDIAGDEIA